MKKLMILSAFILSFVTISAQNTNVTDISKTTVTKVVDSEGEKEIVKQKDIKQIQKIELENADSNSLNKDVRTTPIEVVSSTTVVNPDGSTRTVNVDRSAYYVNNGKKFKLSLDPAGYVITTENNAKLGILRPTSTNSYIFRGKDSVSVGYFDTQGNLILETHDAKSDQVSIQSFKKVY